MMFDAAAESLMRDPQYLLRLYHKAIQTLVKCEASSFLRSLSSSFIQTDARYRVRSRMHAVELWPLKGVLRQIFPANTLSDRELLIIIAMLPLEEYGESGVANGSDDIRVSPVMLLLRLRQMCPVQASLLLEMSRCMDARPQLPHPCDSACGKALARCAAEGGREACILERATVLDFLTESYGMTLSEAFCLIEYCSMGLSSASSSSSSTVAVDGAYLYAFLYQRPLPSDVRFSLLMSVFAEAVCDPNRAGPSGTFALLEGLRRLSLKPDLNVKFSEHTSVCIDAGRELSNCFLTRLSFEELCKDLRVGLLLKEVRQLFFYLRGEGHQELVSVHTLLCEFTRHFVPVSKSLFLILEEAVRRYVVKSGGLLALPRLHLALPAGPISIATFISVLRGAGVPEAVSDVELEWLRFKGQDRERLVLLLSGEFPTKREALVRQLFGQLKKLGNLAREQETVELGRVLGLFHPEKVEGALMGGEEDWRHVMKQCFGEKTSTMLTCDHFLYFWRAVSAACSDDSVFTMILWRSFNMHSSH
ncbi:putative vesicle-fusing ATPase [Trypanosoma conorhini]|uniref:Putative vesicle-fusing ATPase n=1 Tax=Trypanosoma conorhini TaxID=83891 RepID=A0A3R7NRE2_9TRYP|nr:putative vesicle-fusing ATPase [Trypanosoma conorhini]RNF22233.1 putative vesicle-fusing ATPase [Trypanosoma conorhini]